MLRFTFSPTHDMDIEELRIALLNYIVANQRKEDFIVRVEDTDKEKSREAKEQEVLDILGLFGIKHSQVVYQSQNFRFHSAMALQLLHEKKAFACFCSDEWLEKKQNEAKEAKKEYSYDDACRNLPAELVIDNTAPFSIRVVRPQKSIVLADKVQGEVSFAPDTIDSFIIMYRDKTPTYNFASAVDDMLNDISCIITNYEEIKNTAKQFHVRDQLGYDKKIEYAHLPMIIKEQNLDVKYFLEEGYLPEAISNYLISIGSKPPKEIFTLKEAIEWLDLQNFTKEPVVFDIEKLKQINKEHLKKLDATELSRYVGFADAEIGELARIYLNDVNTTKELRAKIAPIFSKRDIPQALKKQTTLMAKVIKNAPYFEEYNDFKHYVMQETAFEEKDYLLSLRLLLTNAQKGPDLAEIYKYIKNYIKEIIK